MSRIPMIPESDLTFVTSRSGGPGGQNVNKVETRVTALLDLEATEALDPDEKARVRDRLATRISSDGVLQVTSQRYRSQSRNRKDAIERLLALLADALAEPAERRKSRPPRRTKERRIEEKKKKSEIKSLRKNPRGDV